MPRGTSRRRRTRTAGLWAVLMVVGLLLSGCGSATGENRRAAAKTTTVEAANGRITVPVTDQDIWALDVYTALNLLAVGVVPDHVGRTHQGQEAREGIAADAGVKIVEAHKLELVVSAKPSLIVGIDHPEHRALLKHLKAIAPVVLIEDGIEINEQMEVVGTMTGRTAEAMKTVGRIGTATATLAARIKGAGHSGRTVSVLQEYPTVFYAYDSSTQCGALLTRLGLDRPEAQSGESEWGYTEVSEENLGEHGADIVVALVDRIYAKGKSVLDSPMLDTSEAITAEVEFSGWYNSDILSAWWVLHDVAAILFHQAQPTTHADVPALWSQALGTETPGVRSPSA
ncbi:ABC transporter substrate-binding protein [Streptomyces sp. NPDC059256]|uniref:ABC transporter substrate-binding protein n=1 Tax=Streptomyces sp. NPDC059256 TaxID=3346794 RepID=UPI0036B51813